MIFLIRTTLLILILLFGQGAVRAQSPTEEESARAAQESVESLASIGTGTNDITSQLALDAAPKQSLILTPRLDSALAKWYDRKADILQRRGLRFVLAYSVLGQHATETIAGNQDNAVGGVFDFGGTWELLNRNTDWRGVLGFRIADQHRLGTDIAPSELGEQVGSEWGTSLAFSDLSLNVIEGWWEQRLAGKVAVRLGKIESSGIFDASSLGN